jgi:hypothetical protein
MDGSAFGSTAAGDVCPIVMAGPDPAIHVFFATGHEEDVDARDKRGHDGVN